MNLRKILISFLALILLLVALFPTLLSTRLGNRYILQTINQRIHGTFEAASISFGWFTGFDLQGASLLDNNGETVVSFRSFSFDRPLLTALLFRSVCGEYALNDLSLFLATDQKGYLNLDGALFQRSPLRHTLNPVTIKDTQIFFHRSTDLKDTLQAKGVISGQGEDNPFSAFVGFHQCSQTLDALTLDFTSLPTDLLDALKNIFVPSAPAIFQFLFSNELSLTSSHKHGAEKSFFEVELLSMNTKGILNLSLKNGLLELEQPSSLTIQGENTDAPSIPLPLPGARLTGLGKISLSIDHLSLPLGDLFGKKETIDEGSILIDARIKAEDLFLEAGNSPVNLHNLAGKIKTEQPTNTLEIELQAEATQGGKSSTFKLLTILDIPKRKETFFRELFHQIDLTVQASAPPRQFLPPFFETLVGEVSSFSLHAKVLEGQGLIEMSLTSDGLSFEGATFNLDEYLTLKEPFSFTLTPQIEKKKESLFCELKSFSVSFHDLLDRNLATLAFHMDASTYNHTYQAPLDFDFLIKDAFVTLSKEEGENRLFLECKTRFNLLKVAAFGPLTPFSFQTYITLNDNGIIGLEEGKANLFSDRTTLEATFSSNRLFHDFTLQAGGKTVGTGMEATLTLKQKEKDVSLEAGLNHASINALLQRIMGTETDLFGGEFATATIHADLNLQSPLSFEGVAYVKSTYDKDLDADLHFSFSYLDQMLLIKNEGLNKLHLNLNEPMFQALRAFFNSENKDAPRFQGTSQATLKLEELRLPVSLKQGDLRILGETKCRGSARFSPLTFYFPRTKETLNFETIDFTFETERYLSKASFELEALSSASSIYIQGTLDSLFDEQFALNLKEAKGDGVFKAHNFSPMLLGSLFNVSPTVLDKIDATFGLIKSANILGSIQGKNADLSVEIEGKNGKAVFDGTVDEGILCLNKPFHATIYEGARFSKEVLAQGFPLFSSIKHAESSFSLTINHEEFQFPLNRFDPSLVFIKSAKLDVGKLYFKDEGQVALIAHLFQSSLPGEIPVWFTPLYFSIEAGKISVKRMDMLFLNRYPTAIWGSIDIPLDKVNMRIGISGYALRLSRGLNVASSHMMVVPYRGTMQNASIDSVKVSAQIASLVARSTGSLEGQIAASLLDLTIASKGKVPKPTTNPLPWQNLFDEPNETAEENGAKPSRGERILDGAKNVLENLFR